MAAPGEESIDETRRRLASPEWRRQEREGHAVGILLLVLPYLLGAGFSGVGLRPLGLVVNAMFLVAVPAVLWRFGPRFGFDRRATVLVVIPAVGLYVHVALAWRLGHHRTRTWKTLEPPWGRTAWTVATIIGVPIWIWAVTRTILA